MTKTFTAKFVYMAHHFILLGPNPFHLKVDKEGWWFEHSVIVVEFICQERMLKTFPGPGYLCFKDGVV